MLSNKVVKIKTCIYQKDFITLEMWMDPRGKYKEGLRLRTIQQIVNGKLEEPMLK